MPSPPTTSRSTRIRPALLLVTTILTLSAVLSPLSPSSPRVVLAATTLHVAITGSDTTGTGTSSKPWKTVQKAAASSAAGDTILVRPGTYPDAVEISLTGTTAAPITFKAEGPGVVLDASDVDRDAVLITESAYVVWEGFRIQGAPRAGLRVSSSHHVTVRGNTFAENGTWGLFTDFSDDLLIEGNESFGADREHGIYHSNSGDRPVIRNNVIHDNYANGIHMNGDLSMGGDGVISGALVEGNLIYGNGRGGGSGINMDGVEASTIRNNVVYDTHASGISMYQIDGGVCSRNNLVQHNTVVVAADGRWAVNIPDSGCTGNRLESNILHSDHGYRGAINVVQGARSGFASDYNVLEDRFTTDDGDSILTLAQWQALGYDTHSVVGTPAALFVNPTGDLHLRPGSPAIDAGRTLPSVTRDRDGNARPQGARSDAGAYESPGAAPAATCTLTPATVKVGDRLTLACRRFGPAESVAVTWDGAPLTAFSTDAAGSGTTTLTVPRTTAGPHTVKLRGAQSGKTNTKRLTVVPSIGLSPRSAAPGATVRVTLRGFAAGETITLRLRTAPRSSRTVRAALVASASGTASTSFVVPTGPAGQYTVEATGSTGTLTTTPFTRHTAPAASSTDDPTATVSPTATLTPSPTASPSTTATPFASPTPSPTMTATSTPSPTTTPSPVPATQAPTPPSPPTETPTDTQAPEPTPSPTPSQTPESHPAA